VNGHKSLLDLCRFHMSNAEVNQSDPFVRQYTLSTAKPACGRGYPCKRALCDICRNRKRKCFVDQVKGRPSDFSQHVTVSFTGPRFGTLEHGLWFLNEVRSHFDGHLSKLFGEYFGFLGVECKARGRWQGRWTPHFHFLCSFGDSVELRKFFSKVVRKVLPPDQTGAQAHTVQIKHQHTPYRTTGYIFDENYVPLVKLGFGGVRLITCSRKYRINPWSKRPKYCSELEVRC
jgi:hypothetical protein